MYLEANTSLVKIKNELAHTVDWAEYQYVSEDAVYTYYRLAPTKV